MADLFTNERSKPVGASATFEHPKFILRTYIACVRLITWLPASVQPSLQRIASRRPDLESRGADSLLYRFLPMAEAAIQTGPQSTGGRESDNRIIVGSVYACAHPPEHATAHPLRGQAPGLEDNTQYKALVNSPNRGQPGRRSFVGIMGPLSERMVSLSGCQHSPQRCTPLKLRVLSNSHLTLMPCSTLIVYLHGRSAH